MSGNNGTRVKGAANTMEARKYQCVELRYSLYNAWTNIEYREAKSPLYTWPIWLAKARVVPDKVTCKQG